MAQAAVETTTKRLNHFERYLSLWVGICMLVGVLVGKGLPYAVDGLRRMEFGAASQINIPIAVLIWLMIIPMMMKVDFASLRNVGRRPRGLLVTLFVNWLVKPFSMAPDRMAVLPVHLLGMDSAGRCRSIHCRLHHSGGCALHGNGVRLELPDRRRSRVHAGSGFGERPDHAGAVRADRALPGERRFIAARAVRECCSGRSCVFIVIPLVAGVCASSVVYPSTGMRLV